MKTLFIPAKVKFEINLEKIFEASKKLPKEIAIVYSVQYQDVVQKINKILEKKHEINKISQVLGCSKINFPKSTKAVLLIGSGKFHAISLAIESKLPVYILENNKLNLISKSDLESIEKKQKASYMNYLMQEEVGILVSTKPGQENLKKALDFKKKLKDKKAYLFLANNLNTAEFENFGLKSWVNTACPRMDMNDSKIINISKL